jgi:hypothetical protein
MNMNMKAMIEVVDYYHLEYTTARNALENAESEQVKKPVRLP